MCVLIKKKKKLMSKKKDWFNCLIAKEDKKENKFVKKKTDSHRPKNEIKQKMDADVTGLELSSETMGV